MDLDIRAHLGPFVPTAFDTEDELVVYLSTHPNAMVNICDCLVYSDNTHVLDWFERHDLLDIDRLIQRMAGCGNIKLMQHCKDKGFDTSGCCSIAFINNRGDMLKWFQAHGCRCDKTQHYHG